MSLQISPNASSHQLTQMTTANQSLLSAHFRNNLKNTNQQGQIVSQPDVVVVNGLSPNSNHMQHQMSHQLGQVPHHPQFQSHNQQQKHLLALASGNQRSTIETLSSQKIPFEFTKISRNNSSNNPNNSVNYTVKPEPFNGPVNGDINNLPELSSFLQWNHSNNHMPFSAFHNQLSSSSGEHFNGFHHQILQQQGVNTSSQNTSQNSSFISSDSPQIKQQPQTPVMSPSPSLQQQHSTGSDMLNSSNENVNNSMVNALTAVINANNSTKAATKIPIHQQMRMNESCALSLENASSVGDDTSTHPNDRSLSEPPSKLRSTNLSISPSNSSSNLTLTSVF